MLALIAGRIVRLVFVLFVVSLATFFIVDLVPGDPAIAILGPEATPEQVAQVREELGLDDPVVERYLDWIGGALTGDLGNSLVRPAFSVSELLALSIPITLQLAVMALVIAIVVSVPTAIWAAYREGGAFDRVVGVMTSALISVPSFLAGLLLAFFFVFHPDVPRYLFAVIGLSVGVGTLFTAARKLGSGQTGSAVRGVAVGLVVLAVTVAITASFPSFPRSGFVRLTSEEGIVENLRSAFLPALTIALAEIAVFTRLLRGDLIATLQEDFILAAKAKGVKPARILWHEALRPSSFSLVTLLGVSLGRAIGGTVIVETIFGIQGVGRLVVNDGVVPGDYPVVQGGVLVIAVFYVGINALVDITYLWIDPRIRRG